MGQYSMSRSRKRGDQYSSGFEPAKALVRGLPATLTAVLRSTGMPVSRTIRGVCPDIPLEIDVREAQLGARVGKRTRTGRGLERRRHAKGGGVRIKWALGQSLFEP